MRIDWHKFISVDPEIHHGEPCITGTRIPVSMIVGSVADQIENGQAISAIMFSYPAPEKSDDGWERLMKLRDELGKHWHSEKSAVEILSEMRR